MEWESDCWSDYIPCDVCQAPGPYRFWCGDELLATLCQECHERRCQEGYELIFAAQEAVEALGQMAGPIGP
jgi:hypothetical protein